MLSSWICALDGSRAPEESGTEAGGSSTLYSRTVSCWELGIDPFAYLTDVLERLATTPSAEIERLTPRDWKSAQH